MLTPSKVPATVGDWSGALKTAEYYLDVADSPRAYADVDRRGSDGPETTSGKPSAIWLGSERALGGLGVKRGTAVGTEQLALALQGLDTVSGAQVRQPGRKRTEEPMLDEQGHPVMQDGEPVMGTVPRVNSIDLAFGAPKSVSLVWMLADPALRAAIERAMLVAANGAIEHLMTTKLVIQNKGAGELASGFAAAVVLHTTARIAHGDEVPAPHLHVHGLVVGVEGAEPGLRTPDTRPLFQHDTPLEGGSVYRALLAIELRKLAFDLEYGTGRFNRFFEIKGVEQELIDLASPRRRELEREVARREALRGDSLSGAAKAALAQVFRQAKPTDLDVGAVKATWRSWGKRFGYGQAKLAALRTERGPGKDLGQLRKEARAAILERMWQQGSTVSDGRALSIALDTVPMGFTSIDQVRDLLAGMVREGDLITLDEGRVTSAEIRSLEEYVIGVARGAGRRSDRPLSEAAIARGGEVAQATLGDRAVLGKDQRDAIRALAGGAGWVGLTGRAGTGKGPVLQAIAEAHRHDGGRVIACSLDGATAVRLGKQITAQALTIRQVLARLEREDLHIDDRTLIVIEEASKVGLQDWAQIASVVELYDAKVLMVGHAGQLGAIELPGMFEEMLRDDAITSATLTKIHRQEKKWLRQLNVAVDSGEGEAALKLLRDKDAITMRDTRGDAMVQMVSDWDVRRRRYEDPRDAILVVHGSNEDVDLVNKLAQKRRREAGDLVGRGVKAPDRKYRIYENDVVMLREAAYQPPPEVSGARWPSRAENGTIGIVTGVDSERERVTVAFEEPDGSMREVDIDLRQMREEQARATKGKLVSSLRLAYAFHPFPLQGATALDVSVLDGHESQNKEGTYVAFTRAKRVLRVYADRQSLGEGPEEERWERYVRRIKRTQHKTASIALAVAARALGLPTPKREPLPEVLRVPERTGWAEGAGLSVPDPLDSYRDDLGRDRADQVSARATVLGDWLVNREDSWLHEQLRKLDGPFETLESAAGDDRAATRELMIWARKRAVLSGCIHGALMDAEELEERAKKLNLSPRRRREREDLLQEAQMRRKIAARDAAERRRLVAAQPRPAGASPLDKWLAEHGEPAARWVAIKRELAVRRELETARERAIEEAEAVTSEAAVEPGERAMPETG